MEGLIQKSGYIRPGNGGGHYAEYIATRDGVEELKPGGYLEYMAERPRSHGLFSADGPADLEQTMAEINAHAGPVWTFIYSLKREDAARLGYENSESWRRLLLAHQAELAAAMKIPPSNFRWCAAFHDEKHHPHIHMMAWSADPKQGYLTEKGIEQMRSQLSNDIFRDELLSLYQEKDLSYQQVRDAAMEAMGRLIREMKSGLCDSPVIDGQMETLAEMLSEVKGKKVYGYLKKPVKAQVDAIVDELARLPEVAECYDHWNRLRDELERYYKDTPREYKPLSQQKEFKAIKNMVIREAEELRLGAFTFEDTTMRDEVDEDQEEVYYAWSSRYMKTQRKKKRNRCGYWSSSGTPASPWPLTCWANAGGMVWVCCRMTNRRRCGSAVPLKRVMTSHSTLLVSCYKVKSGWRKRCPGMRKRRRRVIPTPPTGWGNCIWRERMS